MLLKWGARFNALMSGRPSNQSERDYKKERCQNDSGQYRLDVNLASKASKLRLEFFVIQLLNARVHVARPARGQGHSGLVTRLKESYRPACKWQKQY